MQLLIPLLLSAAALLAQDKPQNTRASYHLGPDDQINIQIANVGEAAHDKPVRIDTDGFIKLPMVGRLKAAGLTAEQLEAKITQGLKVYIEEPDVAISVAEFRSQPVSVIGSVGSPGIHQLQGRKTLIEILSLAGGVRPDAAPVARITRKLEWGRVPLTGAKDDPTGQFSIAEVNLKSIMQARSPEHNIPIFPYDVISIPRAELIFILGDVTKAGALSLSDSDHMTALEALSHSGGMLRTAAPSKAKILRPMPGEPRRTEVPVDLKKIQEGKADDVQLMAGDILFVPGSNSKRLSARAAEAAIQAGTMALTYGIVR